jgi:23S rRNA pseudouridine2605 synthase
MLEAVGHAVSRLIRIRYGAMVLPRGLKRGAWMELDEADIQALVKAAGNASSVDRDGQAEEIKRPVRYRGAEPRTYAKRPPPGRGANRSGNTKSATSAQPDPLKTSVGYIGADSLTRQRKQDALTPRKGPGGQRRPGRTR